MGDALGLIETQGLVACILKPLMRCAKPPMLN